MSITLDIIFKEKKRPQTILAAYCHSEHCCQSTYGNKPTKMKVKPTETDCPRCGHVLVWRREPANEPGKAKH